MKYIVVYWEDDRWKVYWWGISKKECFKAFRAARKDYRNVQMHQLITLEVQDE